MFEYERDVDGEEVLFVELEIGFALYEECYYDGWRGRHVGWCVDFGGTGVLDDLVCCSRLCLRIYEIFLM